MVFAGRPNERQLYFKFLTHSKQRWLTDNLSSSRKGTTVIHKLPFDAHVYCDLMIFFADALQSLKCIYRIYVEWISASLTDEINAP